MREPAIIARISLANALAVERQIEDGKAYFDRLAWIHRSISELNRICAGQQAN